MNKELLHKKFVKEVIALVSSGKYCDGGRLPAERKLCEQFNLSRGTVRQGLLDLEKMGVIRIKPGSGAYVQKVSQRKLPTHLLPPDFVNVTIADIIYARRVIELAAVALACEKITPAQIAELELLVERMAKSQDNLPEFIKYDMGFHQSIVRAGGNMPLVTAFEAIAEYLKYSHIFSSLYEGEEEVAMKFHKKILSELKKHNKTSGIKAMAEHLDRLTEVNASADKKG